MTTNDWPQFDLSAIKSGVKTTILARSLAQIVPGTMTFFRYNPETRAKSKKNVTFDLYPLSIIYDATKDGFVGYNIHFLDVRVKYGFLAKFKQMLESVDTPVERIRLADRVLPLVENKSPWKYTVRRYKYKNISSRIVLVHPEYWETAVNLPLEKFVQGTLR